MLSTEQKQRQMTSSSSLIQGRHQRYTLIVSSVVKCQELLEGAKGIKITNFRAFACGFCFVRVIPFGGTEQKPCTLHACAKNVTLSPPSSLQQIPKFGNTIFCSLGLKILIYRFTKLIYPNTNLSQIAR